MKELILVFMIGMLVGDWTYYLRRRNEKRMGELGKRLALKLTKLWKQKR